MSTEPGVDELLARHHLRDLGVGHTPPDSDFDWWTALYPDDEPEPPETGPDAPEQPPDRFARLRKLSDSLPDWRTRQTADLGGDGPDDTGETPDGAPPEWEETEDPADPAQRPWTARRNPARPATRHVQARYAGLEPRMRWLLVNGAAAALGWGLGLEQFLSGSIASCAHDTGTTPALILGVGMVAVGGYARHRTRTWWPPLAWVCTIPFATALLAVALYAPGVTP